jgi:hypothetical protein
MLKALAKLLLEARRRKAAYERWAGKRPHNRRTAEPPLPEAFCRKVTLPSGRLEVVLTDVEVEQAYRQARHPKPAPEEVAPLPIGEEKVRQLYERLVKR